MRKNEPNTASVRNQYKIQEIMTYKQIEIILNLIAEYKRLYKKKMKNNTVTEKDKFIKSLFEKTKAGVVWNVK